MPLRLGWIAGSPTGVTSLAFCSVSVPRVKFNSEITVKIRVMTSVPEANHVEEQCITSGWRTVEIQIHPRCFVLDSDTSS